MKMSFIPFCKGKVFAKNQKRVKVRWIHLLLLLSCLRTEDSCRCDWLAKQSKVESIMPKVLLCINVWRNFQQNKYVYITLVLFESMTTFRLLSRVGIWLRISYFARPIPHRVAGKLSDAVECQIYWQHQAFFEFSLVAELIPG